MRALALFLALSIVSGRAIATRCPAPSDATADLGAAGDEQRTAFLREGLDRAARRARVWRWLWGATYASLAVGQLAATPFVSSDSRSDLFLGVGSAAFGLAVVLVAPPKVIADRRRLLDGNRSPPEADACRRLADLEAAVRRDAADDDRTQGAIVHVGNVIFNLGLALVLTLGLRHAQQGAINMVLGTVVGEIQIGTRPIDSRRLWERYRAGELTAPTGGGLVILPAPLVDWSTGKGYGFALAGSF